MRTYKAGDGIPKGEYAALSDEELDAVLQELLTQIKHFTKIAEGLSTDKADVERAMKTASPADRLRLAIMASRVGHNGVR